MRAGELLRQNFLSVPADEAVLSAVAKMDKSNSHSVVVVDSRDRYIGIFERSSCIRSRGDISKMQVRSLLHRTSILDDSADLLRCAKLIFSNDTHMLPVLDKYKRVAGVIGGKDVALALSDKMRTFSVADVAYKGAFFVNERDNIVKAIDMLRRKKIGSIAVVDDKKKVVGVVSLKHVVSASAYKKKLAKSSLKVKDVMSKSACVLSSSLPLSQAARKMANSGISEAIVADSSAPAGILSFKDILKSV